MAAPVRRRGREPAVRAPGAARRTSPRCAAFEVYDGVADLYVYFVELAHRLLGDRGRYCVVVPNKWLTAAYGRPLRAFLAKRGTLEGLVDLGRLGRATGALFGADAFPCIAWGAATRARGPIRAAIARDPSDAAIAAAITDAPAVRRTRARAAAPSRGTSTSRPTPR